MYYFILTFLIMLIIVTCVFLFEYRFGNKWVYTDKNKCSKKVLFGSYSSKLECLHENSEDEEDIDILSLIPIEILTKPKIEDKIITNLPSSGISLGSGLDYNDKTLTKKASKAPNFNFETPKIKTYNLNNAGYDLNSLKNLNSDKSHTY
jgi:hypothetical protein